jgi:hypothetical protein
MNIADRYPKRVLANRRCKSEMDACVVIELHAQVGPDAHSDKRHVTLWRAGALSELSLFRARQSATARGGGLKRLELSILERLKHLAGSSPFSNTQKHLGRPAILGRSMCKFWGMWIRLDLETPRNRAQSRLMGPSSIPLAALRRSYLGATSASKKGVSCTRLVRKSGRAFSIQFV